MRDKNQFASLKEVAARCGVSPTTASAALRNARKSVRFSEQTRERILKVAKEMNYRPNRLARAMLTGMVPVTAVALHAEEADLEVGIQIYMHDVLPSAGIRLHELGLEMMFLPYRSHDDQIERLKALIADRLIGSVISNVIAGTQQKMVSFLRKSGLPFVLMGNVLDDSVVSIATDYTVKNDYLNRYAASLDLERVLELNVRANEGQINFISIDPETLAERMVSEAELKTANALLAAQGMSTMRFLEKLNIPEHRKILVEDPRLWSGAKPALLVKSFTSKRARQAANILGSWIENGEPPCKGRQVVKVESGDVEILY